MHIRFPNDIKQAVTRKILKELLILSCISACLCCLLTFFGSKWINISEWGKTNTIIIYIIVIVLPFLIRKIPFKYFDRSFTGKIIEIRIDNDRTYPSGFNDKGHKRFAVKDVKVMIAVIMTDDGRIVEKALAKQAKADSMPINKFKEGDRVGHLYGTQFIQIIPSSPGAQIDCVVCGASNSQNNNFCRHCNHSLKIFE